MLNRINHLHNLNLTTGLDVAFLEVQFTLFEVKISSKSSVRNQGLGIKVKGVTLKLLFLSTV
jgi:hypothetical protein